MSRIILALLLICLTGCAGTTAVEVAVGINGTKSMPWSRTDGGFEGGPDTFRLTIRRDGERTFCDYTHVSHISDGPPFNDHPEDWVDMFECGIRWRSR